MPEQKNILQIFKEKKAVKTSSDVQEARRLVNLYRLLSCFGDEFIERYNQILLSSSMRVQRLLSTFVGGEEVYEYLEFLHQNTHLDNSEKTSEANAPVITQKGFIPMPTEDLSGASDNSITQEIERLKMQQQTLLDQMQRLMQKLPQNMELPSQKSGVEEYSEIIEEEPKERE